ncbi:MAG: hypothetical protein CTY28_10260 [Hyphomicrobium sp.]|nr:MAG: hypothetical protein CTY28_10260 [Hyphomicrobium sp.]
MTNQAIIELRTVGVQRAKRGADRANRQADLNAAFKPVVDEAGPTAERAARSEWDHPETDAKTQRRAYKARDPFLEMLRSQEIDGSQFQAAEQFERHYHGAEGHDVRVQDYAGEPCDRREFGRTVHATRLADARSTLSPDEFLALERLVRESSTLVQIGFGLSGYTNRQQAKAYGLAVVRGALQRLVDLWITERRRPPSRP